MAIRAIAWGDLVWGFTKFKGRINIYFRGIRAGGGIGGSWWTWGEA